MSLSTSPEFLVKCFMGPIKPSQQPLVVSYFGKSSKLGNVESFS